MLRGAHKRRSLGGLRALVTGASSGIGASVCTLLAARGCRVVGSGRSASGLALAPSGALEAAVVRDLTEPGAPADIVAAAVSALGGLDLVISSAGAGWAGPYESMEPAEIDAMIDINLRAPMHLARAAGPHLLAGGGQIVFVGSIAALVGVAEEVAYGAAKAGLRGLADGLRAEWSRNYTCERGVCEPAGSGRAAFAFVGGWHEPEGQEPEGQDAGSRGPHRSRSGRGRGQRGPGTAVTVTLLSPGPVATSFFSRRNRPYTRSWPKPLSVTTVAHSVVRSIEARREDVVIPGWLGLAARLNGASPALYRALTRIPGHFER